MLVSLPLQLIALLACVKHLFDCIHVLYEHYWFHILATCEPLSLKVIYRFYIPFLTSFSAQLRWLYKSNPKKKNSAKYGTTVIQVQLTL